MLDLKTLKVGDTVVHKDGHAKATITAIGLRNVLADLRYEGRIFSGDESRLILADWSLLPKPLIDPDEVYVVGTFWLFRDKGEGVLPRVRITAYEVVE